MWWLLLLIQSTKKKKVPVHKFDKKKRKKLPTSSKSCTKIERSGTVIEFGVFSSMYAVKVVCSILLVVSLGSGKLKINGRVIRCKKNQNLTN